MQTRKESYWYGTTGNSYEDWAFMHLSSWIISHKVLQSRTEGTPPWFCCTDFFPNSYFWVLFYNCRFNVSWFMLWLEEERPPLLCCLASSSDVQPFLLLASFFHAPFPCRIAERWILLWYVIDSSIQSVSQPRTWNVEIMKYCEHFWKEKM